MSNKYQPGLTGSQQSASGHLGPISLLVATASMAGLLLVLAMSGVSPSPLTWYLARASGFTLYLLFWLSITSGLALTTRLLDAVGGRASWWRVHGIATDLSFAFLALHMLTLAADPTEPLGLLGVLVPFMSDVRQPWTDIGIFTAAGMVLVAASFNLRRVIGATGWRLLHYGSFPLWLMALIHGIGSGTDTREPWAIMVYSLTSAIVVFLVLFRFLTARSSAGGVSAPVPAPRRLPGDLRRERL